jgi:hypothetical protein
VRWRVPGEVLPDLLYNTLGTSMTQLLGHLILQHWEVNTLGIRIASIVRAQLVRKCRCECDERCLFGKQKHMINSAHSMVSI